MRRDRWTRVPGVVGWFSREVRACSRTIDRKEAEKYWGQKGSRRNGRDDRLFAYNWLCTLSDARLGSGVYSLVDRRGRCGLIAGGLGAGSVIWFAMHKRWMKALTAMPLLFRLSCTVQ